MMENHRIFDMKFVEVYPHYVYKVEKKGKTEDELLTLIHWLTGYTREDLINLNKKGVTFREFFELAPKMNPNRFLIKGVICGVRVEDIENPLMQSIRHLDKIIDELARGKKMEKILRE